MKSKYSMTILLVAIFLSGCGFQKQVDKQFGDQHFKTSIALIELHKVRTGDYPEQLTQLKYLGDWDKIALSSVDYKKLEQGYELNVTRGWAGAPELEYPKEFWTGLGLEKTNVFNQ